MIGDFPIQFSIYTNCPLHHVFLAWEAYEETRAFLLSIWMNETWFINVRNDLRHGFAHLEKIKLNFSSS